MNYLKSNKENDVIYFFIGLVMLVAGGYLFMKNVEVTTAYIFSFSLGGHRMDGLIFLPLIASIIFIFFRYNKVSKTCFLLSIIIIIVNVIANLRLYWNSISLYETIVIFILLFGGAGLVMKAIFVNPEGKHGRDYK